MRVGAAAEEAGLQLRPRNVRVFDEVLDIVKFDLVLVLDHFDHTEVLQPVHPGYIPCVQLMPGPLHILLQIRHCLRVDFLQSEMK